MNFASLFGAIGTIIDLVRALPQLLRLLRSRGAHGVSVDTAATSALVSFGWATYGILTAQPLVTLASGVSGLIFLLVTFFALRYGRRASEFRLAPIWLIVLLLAGFIGGKAGLGLVMPVSVLVANTPQIRVAWREQNLGDLSLGIWGLTFLDGLAWGTYALLRNDISILCSSIFLATTGALIVILKLRRRPGTTKQLSRK